MTAPSMPLQISEADFLRRVLDLARLRGWRVAHFRPARRQSGAWSTPVQGDPGSPDLILARDGRVILAELKALRGRTSPQQRAWLAALGEHGRLWTPDAWNAIQEELR